MSESRERLMSFADFDIYVDEQRALGNTEPASTLLGQWIANLSGNAIIASPVGEPPEFVAVSDGL